MSGEQNRAEHFACHEQVPQVAPTVTAGAHIRSALPTADHHRGARDFAGEAARSR